MASQDRSMCNSTMRRPMEEDSLPLSDRLYENAGNPLVVSQVDSASRRILDVGCGAGDNARLLRARLPGCEIFGITQSDAEAERARAYMTDCRVVDIESEIPQDLERERFDCLVFSHVLEHLRDPAEVLARMSRLVRKGGQVVIAVPNVLCIKIRVRLLRGDFEYSPNGGILDDTHLHFYTYFTADRYLLSASRDLELVSKTVSGFVPMPGLRELIPHGLAMAIDRMGVRHWPNLFGEQTVITARKLRDS